MIRCYTKLSVSSLFLWFKNVRDMIYNVHVHQNSVVKNTLLSKTVGGQTENSKQTSLSHFVLRPDKPVGAKLQTDITNITLPIRLSLMIKQNL